MTWRSLGESGTKRLKVCPKNRAKRLPNVGNYAALDYTFSLPLFMTISYFIKNDISIPHFPFL